MPRNIARRASQEAMLNRTVRSSPRHPADASPAGLAAPAWAVGIVAAALFLVTGAVNLPTPLYPAYAALSGYGTGATTAAFACYVAGLIPVLLGLGGLSDRIGRKPPLALALLLAFAATAIVSWWPGIEGLAVARALLGIGVALTAAAGTAFLAELIGGDEPARHAGTLVTVSTSAGFGIGALATGAWLFLEETLLPASFLVHMPLTLLCLALLALVPDRRPPVPGPWVRLPYFPNGTLTGGIAIAVAWAALGVIIVLIPAELARHGLAAWSGLAIFLLAVSGLPVVPLARRMPPRRAIAIGLVATPLGYALAAAGAAAGQPPLVLLGAAVTSTACFGFTYLGGLAAATAAAGEERARASAGFFLFAYLGFSLPVMGTGFLADSLGLGTALVLFGMMTTAACGLLALALRRR